MAKVPISATIDKDTNETVKKLAISDRRSNSEMINILLDEAIEARKKK
jgi:hypothetical protein